MFPRLPIPLLAAVLAAAFLAVAPASQPTSAPPADPSSRPAPDPSTGAGSGAAPEPAPLAADPPQLPPPVFRVESAQEAHQLAFDSLNAGAALHKSGDHHAAVEKLRIAAAISMASFDAHFYLGLALAGARRYEEAIGPFEAALELQPKNLLAHVARANALLKLGDQERSEAGFYAALKIKEDFAPALDGLGRLAQARGKTLDAESFYKKAVGANPGYAEALLHLGELAVRGGSLDEAISYLNRAITLRPDLGAAHNTLGIVYGRLGLYDEALAVIARAASLEPKDPSHPTSLGVIYVQVGSPARAAEVLRQAIALDANYLEAYDHLAKAQVLLGDHDGALGTIDQALARPVTDRETKDLLRGRRRAIAAEREETAALRARIEAGESGTDILDRLAAIEIAAGRFTSAIPTQEKLVAERPTSGARERLAYLYLQTGRYTEALPIYEAIAAEVSASPGALVNLGVVRAGLGDDPGAAAASRRALALDPSLGEARLNLGIALYRSGDTEGAMEALAAYLGSAPKGELSERVRKFLASIGWKPDSPPPIGGSP